MKDISKNMYKVTIFLLKYAPLFTLICTMITQILAYHNIALDLFIFLSPSMISLIILVLLSNVFKFCYVHRLPVYWMIIGKFLQMFTGDTPMDLVPKAYYMLIFGGVFCIIYTIIHIIFGNKIRRKLGLEIDEECL